LRLGWTWAAPPNEILMGLMAGGVRAISDGNCCSCWLIMIHYSASYLLISVIYQDLPLNNYCYSVINAWCSPRPKPVKLEGETYQISPSILTGYVGVTGANSNPNTCVCVFGEVGYISPIKRVCMVGIRLLFQ
jgi:hypothetical protein